MTVGQDKGLRIQVNNWVRMKNIATPLFCTLIGGGRTEVAPGRAGPPQPSAFASCLSPSPPVFSSARM